MIPNEIMIKAVKEYRVFDYSNVFSNWCGFVYLFIPNNWLKMHGYPKRRRRN